MTREQAAKILNSYCSERYLADTRLQEACGVAIEALQAQADGEYIKKSDMIEWLKDIRHKMKPQNYHTASEFEIAENQIWNLIQMLQMGAMPSVAIPSTEPKTVIYSGDGYADGYMVYDMAECPNCGYEYEDGDKDWGENFCPHCGQPLKWKSEG